MEMPLPTAAHHQLYRLAGEWRGEDTMFPSDWAPEGSVAQASHSNRVSLGGFGVIDEFEQSRDGVVTFAGVGMWTVDPADTKNQCVLYSFDSLGMGMETYRGGWKGDVLIVQSRNPMGHFKMTYDLSDPDTVRSRMDFAADGKAWGGMFEGVYQRES
jgi:hypothetical protein